MDGVVCARNSVLSVSGAGCLNGHLARVCEFGSYTVALGLLNGVLEATRYLPQVWESWKYQGSGSMSYVRLALSIAGGLGACIQKAQMHESQYLGSAVSWARFRDYYFTD